MKKIKHIINEELNEIFNSKIETKYKKYNKNFEGYDSVIYEIETKTNNKYKIIFSNFDDVNIFDLFDENHELLINRLNIDENYDLKIINISFGLIGLNINYETSNINTNLNEQYDLMGRITYIISEYMKEFTTDIFLVTNEYDNRKIDMYEAIYKNIFKDYNFTKTNGIVDGTKYLFFINNVLL